MDTEEYIHRCRISLIFLEEFECSFREIRSREFEGEKLLFEIKNKVSISFFGPHAEIPPNILQKMIVADLNDHIRKDISRRLMDIFIVITDHDLKRIANGLQISKIFEPAFIALRNGEDKDRNIVAEIIKSPEEWNFLFIPLHVHIFSVHDENATERITIFLGDLVVVRKTLNLATIPSFCR